MFILLEKFKYWTLFFMNMKRKLVKQGSATLMVSLPSKWIKKNKLDKGSEVDIIELDDKITISAMPSEVKSEVVLDLPNLSETLISMLLTNTYRKGYDRIIVNYKDERQFAIMQQVIRDRLIGFDVIKKGKNQCTIENITEPSKDQFENIFSKMIFSMSELFDLTKKRMDKSKEDIESYKEVDGRVRRYDNFCRRMITKRYFSEKSELYWTMLTTFLRAEREMYALNKVLDGNIKPGEKVKELLACAKNMFDISVKAYNKDLKSLEAMHDLEKEYVYKKGYNLLENSKGKDTILAYHIIGCIRQLYLSSSPISGIVM